jgi:acyl-CoA thioester hydrolase
MSTPTTESRIRVRYAETDRSGVMYNARALEWFEVGRGDWLTQHAVTYREMEDRGVLLPVIEAHVFFKGRATYDDELVMTTTARMTGRARIRFDISLAHPDGRPVLDGHTIHAFVNPTGKPIRPPSWFEL